MLGNNFRVNLFLSAWKRYLPVIRILIKRSAGEIQVLNMNRTDFERDAQRKYGYKFIVNFVSGRPNVIAAGNEIIQSFTYILLNDEIISELLLKGDYAFTLNNKYQLEIKNDTIQENVATEPAEETLAQ